MLYMYGGSMYIQFLMLLYTISGQRSNTVLGLRIVVVMDHLILSLNLTKLFVSEIRWAKCQRNMQAQKKSWDFH